MQETNTENMPRVWGSNSTPSQNIEYQKYITDVEYLELNFKMAFCGWYLKPVSKTVTLLNLRSVLMQEQYDIDYNFRLCNESLARVLSRSVDGLIGRVTQSSNLDPVFIWRMWHGWSRPLISTLMRSMHIEEQIPRVDKEGKELFREENRIISGYKGDPIIDKIPITDTVVNPYEIKKGHLKFIIGTICTYYGVTFKATGGFLTKYAMSTIVSQYLQRMDMEGLQKRNETMRDRLGLGNKNKESK